MEKPPSIIENPIIQLIIAFIFAACALSGRLSMIAANICLLIAWALTVVCLFRSNIGSNCNKRCRLILIVLMSLLVGFLVFLLSQWLNKPEQKELTSPQKIIQTPKNHQEKKI